MRDRDRTAVQSAGFPLGTICLIFWLGVHYGAPLGTTWGGVSVHVAAYYALLIGVVIPLAILGVILGLSRLMEPPRVARNGWLSGLCGIRLVAGVKSVCT